MGASIARRGVPNIGLYMITIVGRGSNNIQHHFTEADGAWDVAHNLSLSGEPLIEQLAPEFGAVTTSPMPLIEYHKHIIELKDYRARYQSYWNSTSKLTHSGCPFRNLPQLLQVLIISRIASRRCNIACCASRCGHPGEVLPLQ